MNLQLVSLVWGEGEERCDLLLGEQYVLMYEAMEAVVFYTYLLLVLDLSVQEVVEISWLEVVEIYWLEVVDVS